MISVNVPGVVASKMGAYSPKDPAPQPFLKFVVGAGYSKSPDRSVVSAAGFEEHACE